MEIPIIGESEPFMWGVWVSQSKENFMYYYHHFQKDLEGRKTVGWFSNFLPYYEDTLGLNTFVLFGNDKLRPKLHLAENDHELSSDFHIGISVDKAIKITEICMHSLKSK